MHNLCSKKKKKKKKKKKFRISGTQFENKHGDPSFIIAPQELHYTIGNSYLSEINSYILGQPQIKELKRLTNW